MKIGVISDTHGSLPDAAGDALKKCDYLIHAGISEAKPVTAPFSS